MSAEKGSAFLLKVGDGGQPPVYATVAGMRTTQMQVNGEAVNVTKDSAGWRELLSSAGVRSISVAASGIFPIGNIHFRLIRGRRGSEWAAATDAPGEAFDMLDVPVWTCSSR